MRGILFNASIVLPLCILGMSGCSKPSQGIRVEYVDRSVIQIEKCLKASERPVRPTSLKSEGLPADLEKLASVALAKVSEYIRYSNKTEAIMDSCQD